MKPNVKTALQAILFAKNRLLKENSIIGGEIASKARESLLNDNQGKAIGLIRYIVEVEDDRKSHMKTTGSIQEMLGEEAMERCKEVIEGIDSEIYETSS